jgi:hypothetical protein
MSIWNNNFITPNYATRSERYEYFSKLISKKFPEVKKILNIGGGGKRHLKKFLDNEIETFEVDIVGDNDLNINLDKICRLPLNDNQFDTVIALDVLEHLENFHIILDEMKRVTSSLIFLSLPNCSELFLNIIFNKKRFNEKEGYYMKYYGLPIKYPEDRHRWFCTIKDYEIFFFNYSKINNLEVNFISRVKKKFLYNLACLFSKRLANEFFFNNIWVILKKKNA